MVNQDGEIHSSKDNKFVALLEDGTTREYDGCCDDYDVGFYKVENWEFIGKGVIYSINGARQAMKETKYFFVRTR